MEDLLRALPDDRPVTAICVVEDPAKCPSDFQVVDKTFDQDTDADLWKDGFFGKRITRYICISKEQGVGSEIIESISIIGERDPAPEGFIVLLHTQDSDQRATRKKYICYKLIPKNKVQLAVTDVIVLSKSKKPPQGFLLAGELNSLLICYKLGTIIPRRKNSDSIVSHSILANADVSPDNEQSQKIPLFSSHGANRTLLHGTSIFSVLDDIPFDINPKYKGLRELTEFILPNITIKSRQEIDLQYRYDFAIEHQAQQAVPSEIS